MRASQRALGVVGIVTNSEHAMDSEARALFDTLAEQTAAVLERAMLSQDMVSVQTAIEAERVLTRMPHQRRGARHIERNLCTA